jgi:galactonate dehydratase
LVVKITRVTPLIMNDVWRNLVFLKVETDEGVTGIGEASLTNRDEGVLGYLEGAARRHVVGSDPRNIEELWLRMYRDDFWRGGDIPMTVLSGIEIACWDILGKVTGQPVWRLLGGCVQPRLKAYANGWYTDERTPEGFRERAKVVLARGYRAMKCDPFGPGHYELERAEQLLSIGIIEGLRDAVGPDVEILVEGHGRFSPNQAIRIAKELERFDVTWFEEPVPPENLRALQRVAQQTSVPIATGERFYTRWGYRELLELQACDIIMPDVIHVGGLLETKKVAAMADVYYVTVAPHNSQGPVATAASVHVSFTLSNFKIHECFDDFASPWVKAAVPGVPQVRDGYFALPEGPGLGIALDESVIAEHPRQEGHFNLWAADWHRRERRSRA